MVKNIKWKSSWPILVVILFLIGLTIDRIDYVLTSTANVPIMDYWRYIALFVDKLFNEGITLSDLWQVQEGTTHRHFGIGMLVFLLNAKYFDMNLQFQTVIGTLLMPLNCCFVFSIFLKKTEWKKSIIKCGFILIMLCMFNINQWEILTLPFAFGFNVRIFITLWTINYFDSMQFEEKSTRNCVLYTLFLILAGVLCGSYGPAVLGTFVFTVIIKLILRKETSRTLLLNVFFIGAFLIGCATRFTGTLESTAGAASTPFLNFVMDGTLFRGIFLMLGSSVMHLETPMIGKNLELLVFFGMILFAVYMMAIVLFFYRKMYEKTYVPLMLMAYTAGNILVIIFGRATSFGVDYVVSSRYVYETTLGLVGICWIYLYELQHIIEKIDTWAIARLCVVISSFLIIFGSLGYSDSIEKGIAPYRKIYSESLINVILSGEEITEKNAGPFQSSPEYINQGIELMKKYNLGIFAD